MKLTHGTPIAEVQALGFLHCQGEFDWNAGSRLLRLLLAAGHEGKEFDEIGATVLKDLSEKALSEPTHVCDDAQTCTQCGGDVCRYCKGDETVDGGLWCTDCVYAYSGPSDSPTEDDGPGDIDRMRAAVEVRR